MTFAIDTGNKNPNTVPCSLHVAAPTGTNLKTWQWYDKKCNGSDFYVSWGYMAAPDAGILTLVKYVALTNAHTYQGQMANIPKLV
jgi:hypothetical protein